MPLGSRAPGPWGQDRPRAQAPVPPLPFPGRLPLCSAPPFLGLLGGGVPNPGPARPAGLGLAPRRRRAQTLLWVPPPPRPVPLLLAFVCKPGRRASLGTKVALRGPGPFSRSAPNPLREPRAHRPTAWVSPCDFAGVQISLSRTVGAPAHPVPTSSRAKATITVFVLSQCPHACPEECGT